MRDLHTFKIYFNIFSKDFIHSVDAFYGFDTVSAGVYVYEGVDEGGGGEEADQRIPLV